MSKKLIQAAAGAGGEPVYVDDVFSTYLYEGNGFYPSGGGQTITNGIDLSGEGGMVWIKARNTDSSHGIYDTERGINKMLGSNLTAQEYTDNAMVSANSDGFTLGAESSGWTRINVNGNDYASWTFREQAGFFDVVTYTGTGVARTVSHNLGSTPAVIIVKGLNIAENWIVYHTSLGATKYIQLNTTGAAGTYSAAWNDTAPTSTEFTVGTFNAVNESGYSYVAYLFAHDDQSFGDNSDESIIKCGSYTGTGSSQEINLGFEPQWILIKNASSASGWILLDTMRGWANSSSSDNYLFAHSSSAEAATDFLDITATGFIANSASFYGSGETYIYIAIRRPMKTPEAGTDVFHTNYVTTTSPENYVMNPNFAPDLCFEAKTSNNGACYWGSRLQGDGKYLKSFSTDAESSYDSWSFDASTGTFLQHLFGGVASQTMVNYLFKRATGFFDVVAYTGDGNNPRSVNHNLGVVPELIAIKKRSAEGNWWVWVNGLTDNATYARNLQLSETGAEASNNVFYKSSDQSSTAFKIGAGFNGANDSSANYIAYLFATVAGVSKVGSYTGTGNSLDINCGFSSGARFVLIKRTDSTSDWWVWDSARGIVAGNDPTLRLNSTAAETTTADYIDPLSSGFTLTTAGNWLYGMNYPSGEYIFLAIA